MNHDLIGQYKAAFDLPVDRRGSDSIKWARYAGRHNSRGEAILPLWVADMDFAAPPEVIGALATRLANGVFGYGYTLPAWTEALMAALLRDYDWVVQPDWLVPMGGLVSGLNIAARSIGEPGDAIVTATPVYPALFTAQGNMDRQAVRVPLSEADNWGWDMEAVAAAHTPRTRGLFLCHPHNPIGRVWSSKELDRIARHAEAHDLVVVSDEIHCDLILEPGRRHVPFARHSPEMAARTITLMAPSKTYNIPGLGSAFAVIPNSNLRRRFERAMAGICAHPNILGQVAAIAAYSEGVPWRTALLEYLRENRDLVMTLDGVGGLYLVKPQATYLAWLDCRGLDTTDPHALFEDLGVGLSDGADFGRPGFLRLNFGCPRATLEEAVRRIRRLAG
ncbi:MAG TPA: PatB family C-S lyase [Moraxellaceae bacterium]|nr:PatB family C-S lyase [Moraxellaceae bacterium]